MTRTRATTRIRRLAAAAFMTLLLLGGASTRADDKAAEAKPDSAGATILLSVTRFFTGSSRSLVLLADGRAFMRSGGAPFGDRGVRMGKLEAKALADIKQEIRQSGLLTARFKQPDDPMLLTDSGRRLLIQLDGKSNDLGPPCVAELNAASKALSARISKLIKTASATLDEVLEPARTPALAPWLAAMVASEDLPSQSAALSNLRSLGPDGATAADAVRALAKRAAAKAAKTTDKKAKAKFAYLVRFAEVTLKDITKAPKPADSR